MATQAAPLKAINCIGSNQRVFIGTACAEPMVLIEALREAVVAGSPSGLSLLVSYTQRSTAALLSLPGCRLATVLPGPEMQKQLQTGLVDYLPGRLSHLPGWFRRGIVPIDVALVQVSPPDAEGYCSLGVSVDYTKAAIESASLVIAEVNPRMPRTMGDTLVHWDQLDYAVAVDYRPSTVAAAGPAPPEAEAIGRQIAGLITDGATLQVGLGSIGDAVIASLIADGRTKIRLHTGMLSDASVELIQAGLVEEPAIATMLLGSESLYRFADQNPRINLYPCDYTHNPSLLSTLPKLYAVNFALEVDLTGQVNAESIQGRQTSGVGGQADFVTGAKLNPEGMTIIALVSTARGGTVSRIRPCFDPATAVTTLREDVDYVVTEYGAAHLTGKTAAERCREMLRIAHPDLRKELQRTVEV